MNSKNDHLASAPTKWLKGGLVYLLNFFLISSFAHLDVSTLTGCINGVIATSFFSALFGIFIKGLYPLLITVIPAWLFYSSTLVLAALSGPVVNDVCGYFRLSPQLTRALSFAFLASAAGAIGVIAKRKE